MKYPEHKLSMETALPSSVQSWLGNELEIRGIDSVIYSRYIIHLLLEDNDEECPEYLELFFNPRLDIKSKLKGHSKRLNNQEEKKKRAAIECLQAVSEESYGIEKLVEELCIKLKELSQSSGSDDTDQGDSTPSFSDGSCSELEDPAERYYAAFPALSTGLKERSPNSENCQHNLDIWKDNPLTKSSSKSIKIKKTIKLKDEKKKSRKKYSPNSQAKRKQTPKKPIPKPKSKPMENYHARFMSWPQSDFVPVKSLDKQTTEEKKLCQQVENVLKQMLLSDRSGIDRRKVEEYDNESDGFVSPELQENAFWYTKQFAELIKPIESCQRLYERHSYPFFHNDDVFLDPDPMDDMEETTSDGDKFGLQDLMKNQELENVTESVLHSIDLEFSQNKLDAPDELTQQDILNCPAEMHQILARETSHGYQDPTPYENVSFDDYMLEWSTEKLCAIQGDSPAVMFLENTEWSKCDDTENMASSLIPETDTWSSTLQTNSCNMPQSWYADHYDVYRYDKTEMNGAFLPSYMISASNMEEGIDTGHTNYSQLWDINIWNKTQNGIQAGKMPFLDGFNSTFDDFKSGLNHSPEKTNRNSGLFNISLLNDEREAFETFEQGNNTLIPKITFEACDFNMMEPPEKEFYSNQAYDRSISLTDVHLLKSMKDDHTPPKDKLSRSFELIPSNNSAFKDVVPRKITHVRSDSNINYLNYSSLVEFEEGVKSNQDEEDKKENLYLSPKTHFRPISAIVEDDMSDLHLRDLFGGYSNSRTNYQKYQDISDSGDEDSFIPMFKVCSQHDKYIQTGSSLEERSSENDEKMSSEDQGRPPESEEEEHITQDFDVYGYVDSLTASAQNTPQNVLDVACNTCCDSGYEEANDDDKLVDEKSSWLTVSDTQRLKKSNASEWPHQKGEFTSSQCKDLWVVTDPENCTEISTSVPQSIWKDQHQREEDEKPGNDEFWIVTESENDGEISSSIPDSIWKGKYQENEETPTENNDFWVVRDTERAGENCSSVRDNIWNDMSMKNELSTDLNNHWMVTESENPAELCGSQILEEAWSCNDENNFPDMFSFFSEDCDDLKSYSKNEHLASVKLDTKSATTDVHDVNENLDDVTRVKLVIGKGKKVLQDIDNCQQQKNVSEPIYVKGYMPMPQVALYSCELEKEWFDKEPNLSGSKSSKIFKGIGKKPCSFFMEGSCKRSDCKFSHDLSSITCRFWEEGDCFKGELCPFLHSYYASEIPVEKENIDERFEFQEEEFPQLSVPVKKQRIPKIDKPNTFVDSRKYYRTPKPKISGKSAEKMEK